MSRPATPDKVTGRRAAVVFALSFAYLSILAAPDMTWINTCSDGNSYLASAKYLVLSHPTGAPLYNLINSVIVRVPLGNEFWRIAMGSVAASSVTATLLYLITKSLLAPLIFLAAGLVVSQSTIVETYSLATMSMVLAYYLHLRGRDALKYAVCGLGLAVHHLVALALLPLLFYDRWHRKKLRNALFVFVGLPFYLYIPLANRPPYNWIRGETFGDYVHYFTSQTGLVMGIDLLGRDMWVRLQDMSLILAGSLGVALLLIALAFKRVDNLLKFLFLLPVVYYATNLAPQTYVYMMPSIAFGAIIATKAVGGIAHQAKIVTVAVAVVLLFVNLHLYDIGRTLDPAPTSARQFYQQLDELPDGSAVKIESRGWETVTVWLYKYDNPDRNIKVIAPTFAGTVLEGATPTHTTELVDPRRYLSVIRELK